MPRKRDTRTRRGLNLRSIAPEVVSELKAHALALGITPSEYVRRLTLLHNYLLNAALAGRPIRARVVLAGHGLGEP